MAARRVATPEGLAPAKGNPVFKRRYATQVSLGHGSVDWKSTATIKHRYAVTPAPGPPSIGPQRPWPSSLQAGTSRMSPNSQPKPAKNRLGSEKA
jgi:hypothetical protein